jgi:hypothetical protein
LEWNADLLQQQLTFLRASVSKSLFQTFHQIIEKYLKNLSCIELSIISPKQLLSESLSRHSFYIILSHFSRFFHFPPAFHFLCISLWRCVISSLSAIFSLALCNFNGDSSSPLQRRFLIPRSSSAVASVLLSLPLSLRCLGAWGLVQRGMGLWMGLVQKGPGFSFVPICSLITLNFFIWYVLRFLGFDDLEPSLFVSKMSLMMFLLWVSEIKFYLSVLSSLCLVC